MKKLVPIAATMIVIWAATVMATSGFKSSFNTLYGTAGTRLDACSTCHTSNIPDHNPYGADIKVKYGQVNDRTLAIQMVENMDSDGDGATNIVEIVNLTLPGDPNDTTPVRAASWGAIKSLYQ